MNWAEEKALEFYEKNSESRPAPPTTYYHSRKLNYEEKKKDGTYVLMHRPEELKHKVELPYDAHFDNRVNTNFSSVHVPTSIYERSKKSSSFSIVSMDT